MTTPIEQLHALGQSLWYDNIQRSMLENGELAAMIERGELKGMTSNPSIFNQAIARSTDYDAALTAMAWAGHSAGEILDRLIVEDIRAGADLFLPIYRETNGGDGYVSVEVSPELANDTEGTLAEARRLWELVDKPNLMIKIPATKPGLPAIRRAISAGMNVNITLIFSIERYREVMEAYLAGLEERLERGEPLDRIASVASFFVSRIDNKADKALEEVIRREGAQAELAASLLGKIAIANARLAYADFRDIFLGERFERLKDQGARLQRPLWASTSTKNPAYPATLYVDELIGPDTVNTVPPQTLDAYREIGTARLSLDEDMEGSQKAFDDLAGLGISLEQITQELEDEGVKAFSDAFASLVETVEERRQAAVHQLGPLADAVAKRVRSLESISAPERIWQPDPSLWTTDEAGQEEIRARVGWLELPQNSRKLIPELEDFREEVYQAGFSHALLLGMGGSSLAPEVMSLIFSGQSREGEALTLSILDSTDPAQVQNAIGRSPVDRTLYIVSSKSGGTAEVSAFLETIWSLVREKAGSAAGDHFIAITDPGTSLQKLAEERGFRSVFHGDPNVGGRFSVLSVFGLVPAALMGIDLHLLLERAGRMQAQCLPDIPAGRNPGLVLGAVMGEAAVQGRDKLTLIADPALASFGSWLEQLVAESSGKQGRGIIPVDQEPLVEPEHYGGDRLFVQLGLKDSPASAEQAQSLALLRESAQPALSFVIDDPYDLGAEFYRWCYATAAACSVLGVNPFDQPDVQDNKNRTNEKIRLFRQEGVLNEGQPFWQGDGIQAFGDLSGSEGLEQIVSAFLAKAQPGDYLAMNAYLPRLPEMEGLLATIRTAILRKTGLATTVGFGPRFLHSTGQLHKGGPDSGLFLQITADPQEDLEIPGQGYSFAILERAQALGDYEALQARGRRVLRLHFASLSQVKRLLEVL
jgi:transaldolase / glucose-6-phosphate isomerase